MVVGIRCRRRPDNRRVRCDIVALVGMIVHVSMRNDQYFKGTTYDDSILLVYA